MPKKPSRGTVNATSPTDTTFSSADGAALSLRTTLIDNRPLPRLIVFDLDYTLWPFWVDTHVTPPVRAVAGGAGPHAVAAVDKVGDTFSFYPDVAGILSALPYAGLRVGVASRTHAPDLAREMLKLLHVPQVAEGPGSAPEKRKARRALDAFDAGLEIYPSSKIRHMEALSKRTGIPYSEILFFDDESRNRDVETLGVTMHLVRDGVTWNEVDRGIKSWRLKRGVR